MNPSMVGTERRGFTDFITKTKRRLGNSRMRHAISRVLPIAFPYGSLRRLEPVSRDFGYRRGGPVDRYYIERFLQRNTSSIAGRVLEIGDRSYTLQFASALEHSDVLHVDPENKEATIIGDLSDGSNIPSNTFDCVICTQTLHLIYDFHAAVRTLHRILRPNGVLLATVPGVSQISTDEWKDTWYWSFSSLAARRMFEPLFHDRLDIGSDGNVLASVAQLHGISRRELSEQDLDYVDPQYELIVHIKGTKAI